MARYRKFFVALAGVIAMGLHQFAGVGDGSTLFGLPIDQLVDTGITIATALGVYQVPNEI